MKKSEFGRLFRRIEEAESLPPRFYTDPGIFNEEMRLAFQAGWVSVGRAEALPEPGDYLSLETGTTPVVLVRDQDGQLRAFGNSCRHRGMRLLEPGRGHCKRIVCPFHAWTYGLDGELRSAPRMGDAVGFCRADYGLVSIPLACRAGFVFINIDGNAPPIDEWLGEFEALHRPWQIAGLETGATREFEVGCNWKSFLEVFNEYYHLQKVHPGTFSIYYAPPDAPETVRGNFSTQFGGHQDVSSAGRLDDGTPPLPPMPGLSGRELAGTRYTWVYPNLTFAASVDALWALEAVPLSPSSTRATLTLCFPSESTGRRDFPEQLEKYLKRMEAGLAEDIPVLEGQQQGLSSSLARPGRFSPRLEPSVHAFQCWIASTLTG